MGFLTSMLGTTTSPSTAFNVGAGAAATRYPVAPATSGQPQMDPATYDAIIKRMREESDRAYQLQKDQLDQNYKVAMMNARTNQDQQRAAQAYQEGQLQLATDKLTFEREVSARDFGQRQYEFNTNTGLQQAKLGYDLIGQMAQLSGPADYFKAANLARGTAGNPQTSTFLSALQSNARLADFGGQAGIPEKETLSTLTDKLTGQGQGQIRPGGSASGNSVDMSGGGGAYSNADNYLAQIAGLGAAGAHKLGAGSLESLTPTERQLFTAGLGEAGYDPATFMAQYARSRIGNRYSASRAA